MSLLVIDFNYLDSRDGEIIFKVLATVDSTCERVSSYIFKRPYTWDEVPVFNARINHATDHGCNWNDGDVLYSELETVLKREASSVVAIYCFGSQKSAFMTNLIDHTVTDIT